MISVCMATYNGEKYINIQIMSILEQLDDGDELVISDDGSNDSTLKIVESFLDPRVKLFKNSFKNVTTNFEFAISQSKGDYIFLADQDDIWKKDKVKFYLERFRSTKADLVVSNLSFINAEGEYKEGEFYKFGFKSGLVTNLIKNNFIGCSMAFKSSAKKWILPFPKNLPMHDWWIGLIIANRGEVSYIEEKLLLYRRHEKNVTSGHKSSIINIIEWRWTLLKNILQCQR